jgi:hypothetical protein
MDPQRPLDHLQRTRSFGWWSLLVWLSLGMVLEAMHGFKVGWYLDVGNDARRLMLRLAHTHGTLIALIAIGCAATMREQTMPHMARAGACLRWAGVLMPLGFLFGGLFPLGGDPGFAVVAVPIGGVFLFAGVLLIARAQRGANPEPAATPPPSKKPANVKGR